MISFHGHHDHPRSIDVEDLVIRKMWSSYYCVDESMERRARYWSWRWDCDVVVSFALENGLERYPPSLDGWIWMMMLEGLLVVVAEYYWSGED